MSQCLMRSGMGVGGVCRRVRKVGNERPRGMSRRAGSTGGMGREKSVRNSMIEGCPRSVVCRKRGRALLRPWAVMSAGESASGEGRGPIIVI